MLDREECIRYLRDVKIYTSYERAANYDERDFQKLYTLYDEDKNDFLEKHEMAVFLKKVFAIKRMTTIQPAQKQNLVSSAKRSAPPLSKSQFLNSW